MTASPNLQSGGYASSNTVIVGFSGDVQVQSLYCLMLHYVIIQDRTELHSRLKLWNVLQIIKQDTGHKITLQTQLSELIYYVKKAAFCVSLSC